MTHKNLLFDLDQTLLNFHASEHIALGLVLVSHGLNYSEDVYTYFKSYNKSLWLQLEKGIITRQELFRLRFTDIIRRCGGDPDVTDPMKVNSEFIETMSRNGVLMEGALEFIKRVKENIPDCRIWIASNGATVNAKGRIESTGLDEYIDGLYISESMGIGKPSPGFFDYIFDDIGETRESAIMIGDSLTSDMLGAKNAGITSVWFMPEGDVEPAVKEYDIDYTASSFDELFEVLRKWSEADIRRELPDRYLLRRDIGC